MLGAELLKSWLNMQLLPNLQAPCMKYLQSTCDLRGGTATGAHM